MTGKVEWRQGNILVTDITILHQMSGPGTNKNGKRLLHGKPDAINPGVCVHRRCCKWILLRLLFPAAGALGRACWELPTPGCLCAVWKPPLLGRPDMEQRNTEPAEHPASSPKMDESAKQLSISCPACREPFPWLMPCESQEWFSKIQHVWMNTHLTCPTCGVHARPFIPSVEDSWASGCFLVSCQGSSYLVEGNAIPQEMFCAVNPFIFIERILLILRNV